MSEDDQRNVRGVINRFTGNYNSLLMEFVALGCGSVNKIDKLRGCYLVTKEDPSVIFDPVQKLLPMMVPIVTQRQWMLNHERKGFMFVPSKFLHPYLANKKANHPLTWYWCDIFDMGHRSHVGQYTKTSANLSVAMTNYVCYQHDMDNDMIPLPHLNIKINRDQRKALNPTTRDVQIGAVIGQIFGDKAKTKMQSVGLIL